MGSYSFIFLIILSFAPSLFWLFFYYHYFPRLTTPKIFLGVLFFLGMAAAGMGFLIHQGVLRLLPAFVSDTFQRYLLGPQSFRPSEVLIMFLLTFFLVAPVEELLKFLAIKLAMDKKPGYLDQIIDGIKFGIFVGLGFAAIENIIYFYQPLAEGKGELFFKLFLTRFFISTVAHSLYTGILGYYIGLSRLYRLNSGYFLKIGLFLAIALHGTFNFFLLVNLEFFSVGVLIVLLWVMIKWGWDRENLESFINKEQYQSVFVPIFSGKKEMESFLFRHKIRYSVVKKLDLCPFCFKKREPHQDICPYCKKNIPKEPVGQK